MSNRRGPAAAVLLAVLTLTLSSCSGGPSAPRAAAEAPARYRTATAATLEVGDPIPRPVGKPVLVLSGRISRHNVGSTLSLDLATLERMGLVEYSVDDSQAVGRTVAFRGVLLRRLLDVAGAAKGATTLHAVALNDYTVDIPVADTDALPVLLATSADGHRMPVDRYGPLRVVYPYGAYDLDPAQYDPRWIWQLSSIEVR